MKNYNKLINDISVKDVIKLMFLLFITYAVIDVCWKVSTHHQYDMEKLTKDIQEYFPDSELTFQNIKVVDSDFKVSQGRGASTTYQETQYLFIRNGTIREEPDFLVVLFLLPVFIIFSVFTMDDPDIKLKDLPNLDANLIGFLVIALFIMLFSASMFSENKYHLDKYKNPKAFTFEVEDIRKEINIDDYKK